MKYFVHRIYRISARVIKFTTAVAIVLCLCLVVKNKVHADSLGDWQDPTYPGIINNAYGIPDNVMYPALMGDETPGYTYTDANGNQVTNNCYYNSATPPGSCTGYDHFDLPMAWLSADQLDAPANTMSVPSGASSFNVRYNYSMMHVVNSAASTPHTNVSSDGFGYHFNDAQLASYLNPTSWQATLTNTQTNASQNISLGQQSQTTKQLAVYYSSNQHYRFAKQTSTPTSTGPDYSSFTVNIPSGITPGTYNLNITGNFIAVNEYPQSGMNNPYPYQYVCVSNAQNAVSSSGYFGFSTNCGISSTSLNISITVNAVTCTLTANPSSIVQGQSSVLSWNASNFDPSSMTAKLMSGSTVIGNNISMPTGTYTVSPSQTTQYNIAIYNSSSGQQVSTCPTTPTVVTVLPPDKVNNPYLRATGNDVWAGAAFASSVGSACQFSQTQISANTSTNGGAANNSSGSDYGIFSSGVDFVTSTLGFLGQNGTSTNGVFNLIFGNANSPPNIYGSFGSPLCLPDYYDSMYDLSRPSVSTVSVPGSPGMTIEQLTGGNSIGPINIPAGVQLYVLVNGDVTINGNIAYSNVSGGASPSWPAFVLISKGGAIKITHNVTSLAGTYISQPNGSAGGDIDTCSDVGTGSSPNTVSGQCAATQLAVNGQLIGQNLILHRLYGSISTNNTVSSPAPCLASSNLNGCAAEWVQFDPSIYLTQIKSNNLGLPQSLNELPPIY